MRSRFQRWRTFPWQPVPSRGRRNLSSSFKVPSGFSTAKFGIWAHWGPQAVPGDGDWYASEMYRQNTKRYGFAANADHVARYGPPSKFGYKDILPLWKAEKWEPDRLMELYKAAGAHYFVAQAVHHDNFDNWDSKYHKWNSVNIGPHKDMVGVWQAAARKQGLPFGVSEHLGHSFTFMQTAHGSDKTGPLAGVPYDGANPAYWDLYQLPAKPGDTGWYSNDPRWAQEWYARMYDLVTRYKPDLLYSDGGLPFGETGRNLVAQLYNVSAAQHGGKPEAVYCCKKNYNKTDFIDGTCVQDLEGRMMADIQPFPWQTDASTGVWFWVPKDHYLSSTEVICGLTDIVSKNGNLLLNVTLLPDGSLAPEMETFLREMADWMKVNGEAIFGTRPWTVYGEGPTPFHRDAFSQNVKYTPQDIRFTRKGRRHLCHRARSADRAGRDPRLGQRVSARHPGTRFHHAPGQHGKDPVVSNRRQPRHLPARHAALQIGGLLQDFRPDHRRESGSRNPARIQRPDEIVIILLSNRRTAGL